MAILRHLSSARTYPLESSHLVGRSHACALRLEHSLVSLEHAAFHWTGGGWELKDLASSNGTFSGQRRLASGERLALVVGALVAFGDPRDPFELIDDSPPPACAHGRDGSRVYAEDGMMSLTSQDSPPLLVYEDDPGEWFVESANGTCRRVSDGETLAESQGWWRLALPQVQRRTDAPDAQGMRVSELALRLQVSEDQEDVTVTVSHAMGVYRLDARAHSYLLLALAQQRVADDEDPALSEGERGWVERDALMDSMPTAEGIGVTAQELTMEIYRVRKRFQKLGVIDYKEVVQRRWSSGKVRLGIGHIHLVSQ